MRFLDKNSSRNLDLGKLETWSLKLDKHPLDVVLYFSEKYASRAALLGRSLKPFLNGGQIHAMVADQVANEIAVREGFTAYHMEKILQSRDFYDWDKKTFAEKLFTLGPTFTFDVIAGLPEGRRVLYLNSDIFFLRDPHVLWADQEGWDVKLFPHNYSFINRIRLKKFGEFNAGAIAITKSEESLKVIEKWANECASWCFDRAENGKYADQKYLEDFELWSSKVSKAKSKTMNLASWVSAPKDGDFLNCIFYHFHGLVSHGEYVVLPHIQYLRLSKKLEKNMHRDYLEKLGLLETELRIKASLSPRNSDNRPIKYWILFFLSRLTGQVVRQPFSANNAR